MRNITLTFLRKGSTVWSDGDDYYATYVHEPTKSKWKLLWQFSQGGRHIGSIRKWVENKWEHQGEVFRFNLIDQGLKVELDILESDETYESVSRAMSKAAGPPPSIVPRTFGLPLQEVDTMPDLKENPLGWA